jgi:hypothetical protein
MELMGTDAGPISTLLTTDTPVLHARLDPDPPNYLTTPVPDGSAPP